MYIIQSAYVYIVHAAEVDALDSLWCTNAKLRNNFDAPSRHRFKRTVQNDNNIMEISLYISQSFLTFVKKKFFASKNVYAWARTSLLDVVMKSSPEFYFKKQKKN